MGNEVWEKCGGKRVFFFKLLKGKNLKVKSVMMQDFLFSHMYQPIIVIISGFMWERNKGKIISWIELKEYCDVVCKKLDDLPLIYSVKHMLFFKNEQSVTLWLWNQSVKTLISKNEIYGWNSHILRLKIGSKQIETFYVWNDRGEKGWKQAKKAGRNIHFVVDWRDGDQW